MGTLPTDVVGRLGTVITMTGTINSLSGILHIPRDTKYPQDQMSFRNPDYWLVIGVAVGWPLVVPYAVYRRWVCGG